MEELPKIIRESLKTKVDIKDLNEYVSFITENSFQFDHLRLEHDIDSYFYHNGNTVDVNITSDQMRYFLEQNKETFDQLVSEHIKKIQQYKNNKNR